MSGWTEQVQPERDLTLVWVWIWRKSGTPRIGVVYDITRRAKHSCHYVVRSCKKNKFETQKQKIAANLGKCKTFSTEIKKINPTGRAISNSIGEPNGANDIS